MRWLYPPLLAASFLSGLTQARADIIVSLTDVTFAGGGTVTGGFDLNVYSYLGPIAVTATNPVFGTISYSAGSISPSTPPATAFDFATPGYNIGLVLDLQSPLGATFSGADPLVPGAINGNVLSGSYEVCSFGCGQIPNGTYELIAAGTLTVTEPATVTLLGAGMMLLPLTRWRNKPLTTASRR